MLTIKIIVSIAHLLMVLVCAFIANEEMTFVAEFRSIALPVLVLVLSLVTILLIWLL